MGFQTGSQVRPELSRPDLSGFHQAAQMNANTYAQLGASITGAVQSYKKKKEEKELFDSSKLMLTNLAEENQEAGKKMGLFDKNGDVDEEAIHAAVKSFGSGKDAAMTLRGISEFAAQSKAQKDKMEQDERIATATLNASKYKPSKPQAPNNYTTPDGEDVLGSWDSNSGQVIDVNTGKPIPKGSTKTKTPLMPSVPLNKQVQEKIVLGQAEEASEWLTGGSYQSRKQLNNLESAVSKLASGDATTGNFLEFVPDIGGVRKSARALINPMGQDAYDNVVAVVATTLKEALGAQFTEREGQRILDASYNPQLSPEANIERLKPIMAAMKATIEQRDKVAMAMRNGKYDPDSFKSPSEVWDVAMADVETFIKKEEVVSADSISPEVKAISSKQKDELDKLSQILSR